MVTAVISLLFCSFMAAHYRRTTLQVSVADYLVTQREYPPFYLLLLPLCMLAVQFILRHELMIAHILRVGSRRKLWMRQVAALFKTACLFSTGYFLFVFLFASFQSSLLINWDQTNSLFYGTVKDTLTIPFAQVALVFLSSCFLGIMAEGLLFLLLQWLFHKSVISWIGILACACWDAFMYRFPLLAGQTSIHYRRWMSGDWSMRFMIVLALCVAGIFIGVFRAGKKEFLHEGRPE